MLAAGMAVTMAATLGLTGCSGGGDTADSGDTANTAAEGGDTAAASEDGIEKPEKITIMVDGTVFTQVNARDKFEARWEELTGIDLEIIQPDHDAYYDVVGQTFASGPENWPDAMILSSSY